MTLQVIKNDTVENDDWIKAVSQSTLEIEIKLRDIDPSDNTGLISAWVQGIQVGSFSFGFPMRKAELRFDLVAGQLVVKEEYRRKGVATVMMDKFLEYSGSKSVYMEFTPEGEKFWEAYQLTRKVLTVYDLIPQFDSYLNDMESCLSPQPETWQKYLEDPVPFITDLLCDFGKFPESITQGEECIEVARIAAHNWVHPTRKEVHKWLHGIAPGKSAPGKP